MNLTRIDNKVCRGSRPLDIADWDELIDAHIATVLDLKSGEEAEDPQSEMLVNLGIAPVHIKMSFITPPTKAQIDEALAVLKDSKLAPVFVHCKDGVDRTGVVCAAYRVAVCGWSVDNAILEMKAMGFHRYRYFWWIPFVKKILRGYESKS